jgi:hypothetical protein
VAAAATSAPGREEGGGGRREEGGREKPRGPRRRRRRQLGVGGRWWGRSEVGRARHRHCVWAPELGLGDHCSRWGRGAGGGEEEAGVEGGTYRCPLGKNATRDPKRETP